MALRVKSHWVWLVSKKYYSSREKCWVSKQLSSNRDLSIKNRFIYKNASEQKGSPQNAHFLIKSTIDWPQKSTGFSLCHHHIPNKRSQFISFMKGLQEYWDVGKKGTPRYTQLRRGESWQPITEELSWFFFCSASYSCWIMTTFSPASANQSRQQSVRVSTLHPSHRCQRGSCCLLPGCTGRYVCRRARTRRRNRVGRRTGSRSPPAGGPVSLGGSQKRRWGPGPPGLCTWRRPLEDRVTGPLLESHGVCTVCMDGESTINNVVWGKLIEEHVVGNK